MLTPDKSLTLVELEISTELHELLLQSNLQTSCRNHPSKRTFRSDLYHLAYFQPESSFKIHLPLRLIQACKLPARVISQIPNSLRAIPSIRDCPHYFNTKISTGLHSCFIFCLVVTKDSLLVEILNVDLNAA